MLDEYDTPMQETYVRGYWDELTGFTRSLFSLTLNNLEVVTEGATLIYADRRTDRI